MKAGHEKKSTKNQKRIEVSLGKKCLTIAHYFYGSFFRLYFEFKIFG